MPKSVLTILSVLCLFAFAAFVWPTRYKYYDLKFQNGSLTIRESRFTGGTWRLTTSGWIAQDHVNFALSKLVSVSATELPKIRTECDFYEFSNQVHCEIGNDTDYTLSKISIKFSPRFILRPPPKGYVEVPPPPGTDPLDLRSGLVPYCTAELQGTVAPHTAGDMFVKPACLADLRKGNWTSDILAAYYGSQ
jgi:hypothetical protein